MPKKVSRAGAIRMIKNNTATSVKPTEKPIITEKTTMTVVKKEETVPGAQKELSLEQKIHKVENLQLVVNKRAKLLQTRNEIERFHIASNDFNCTMQLKDSDGNTFSTSFTPGIKKVIEFLKASFDTSIKEVETQIKF